MIQTATDQQKIEEFDRQMSQIESGLSDTILCLWCGALSQKSATDCCDTFRFSRDERGRKQLDYVIKQHTLMRQGLATCISCPYCKAVNYPFPPDQHPSEWKRPMRSPVCCDTFELAMKAIVQRITADELIARKKRIEDGIVTAGKN